MRDTVLTPARFSCNTARYRRTTRFDTETELLLRAAKRGTPLVEVPISTIYPPGGAPTHFRDFRDTVRIIRLVLGSPFWSPAVADQEQGS